MQDFFHADTTKYKRFARRISIALGIFLSLPAVLCFLSLILGFRQLSVAHDISGQPPEGRFT